MSDLHWIDEGSGRPLALLHGGFLSHEMWNDQISALSSHYRVIAPDARGHGLSPNAAGPFRHTDDVAELLRGLGIESAVLIGLSMGGGVAVDTALEHPDLVEALVVSGVGTSEPAFADPWTTRVWSEWNAAMAAGDFEASVGKFTLFAAGPHRSLDQVDGRVVDRLRRMTVATMAKHDPDEPNWMTPVPDTWERAASIAVPVLAINGAIDSPDHIGMAERLIETVPSGRAVAVDDTAHYPNMERPGRFNELLADFLATV